MSEIELAKELKGLAAHPSANTLTDAFYLLRLVCHRLKFARGVYARADHSGSSPFHLQAAYPATPVLVANDVELIERWLSDMMPSSEAGSRCDELGKTEMATHPFCVRDKCRCFIGVPIFGQGRLRGVFGFFHTEAMTAWSPFAEHSIGIMTSWFVERLAREEGGFSMLPEAELQESFSMSAVEVLRSTTQQFVLVMDPSGHVLEMNRAFLKFENRPAAEVRGRHLCDLSIAVNAKDGIALLGGAIEEANANRTAHRELVFSFGADPRIFQFSLKRVRPPHSDKALLLGEALELTEHFRAVDQYEDQLSVLESVFNESSHFTALLDPDGALILANQAVLSFIGDPLEKIRGQKWWDLPWFPGMEPSQKRMRQAVMRAAGGTPARIELLVKGAEQQVMSLEFSIKPIMDSSGRVRFLLPEGYDVSTQKIDFTDGLVWEREVHEAVRLESLGVLAGGVAHDFNNLLTSILGNASLLQMDVPPDSETAAMLVEIVSAARRSASLCNQMLAFSGHGQIAMTSVDLSHFIQTNYAELSADLRSGQALHLNLAENLPPLAVDERQLLQLLGNLTSNAMESVALRGGEITIQTRLLEGAEGPQVSLVVSDNGCGMNEQTRVHACDPFFSTKFTGRGLGLAAVSGIVRGHRGQLRIQSQLGEGTEVEVLFPVSPWNRSAEPQTSEPANRSRQVLVVDDDGVEREVLRRFLKTLGFQARLASDGLEAIEMVRRAPGSFCLALVDLIMPRMDGGELFEELHRLEPGLPVVLMTGYSEQDSVFQFGEGLSGFLPKPLTLAAVKASVESVVDTG